MHAEHCFLTPAIHLDATIIHLGPVTDRDMDQFGGMPGSAVAVLYRCPTCWGVFFFTTAPARLHRYAAYTIGGLPSLITAASASARHACTTTLLPHIPAYCVRNALPERGAHGFPARYRRSVPPAHCAAATTRLPYHHIAVALPHDYRYLPLPPCLDSGPIWLPTCPSCYHGITFVRASFTPTVATACRHIPQVFPHPTLPIP